MEKISQAVASYKANPVRNYGPNGAYVLYFAPAFDAIEAAFASRDFEKFKEGCELLLNLIARD